MEYKMEELLPVVKKLAEKYTGKMSTSITYEKAEQLMGAVLYCIRENRIGRYMENEVNEVPDIGTKKQQIMLLEDMTAMEAYNRGYELVIKKVYRAKEVYEELLEVFDSYGCLCYYDTVVKGIPEFFINYDPRFEPANHILTLDYPVEGIPSGLGGIDLIYEYLKIIRKEQQALGIIPRREVLEILKGFHWNYKELFINVYTTVMENKRGIYDEERDGIY